MISMPFRTAKPLIALCLAVLTLAACTPTASAPATSAPGNAPTLVVFPGTPTPQCVMVEELPQIKEVQPEEIRPGTEVTVSGDGGFLKDNCGGYIESARTYQIFFDDEPIADLNCYVHYCQGKFVIPQNTEPGSHCLGVQKGTCQMRVDVTSG